MSDPQEQATKAREKSAASPSEEDRQEDLSPVPTIGARPRRGGVSAETYSEEDAATYVKKVN